MTSSIPRISVVIPTKNAGTEWIPLCRHLALVRDRYDLEVLVIDSGSSDRTVEHAREAGLRVHELSPDEFGHGRTRNLGVRMTSGDVICFLTQDVLPCTPDWPMHFAEALADPQVAGAYGRQVPRDASTMEMFFVTLNYPAAPLRFRAGEGSPRPGRVIFSNAFSAIRRDAWSAAPFPEVAVVSEDQLWARLVMNAGYEVLYVPRAEALHAHRYTLRGLFSRTYLIGRALAAANLGQGATAAESFRFLGTEIGYFIRQGHAPRLPQLLLYEFIRWAGFQVGRVRGRLATPRPV
jgi:glycosyltransferase involved in cell wall biosynthesis